MHMLTFRHIFSAVFVTGVAAAALAGCGGSTATTSPGLCGAPSGKVALVYPAPNSTGIPDNFSGIIFGSTNGLASSYEAWVVPNGASAPNILEPVVTVSPPLPSPSAIPPFSNPVYQESGSDGLVLPAATSVAVYLNDGNSNCTASFMGSFTTQ